jgi:hypothetical protein
MTGYCPQCQKEGYLSFGLCQSCTAKLKLFDELLKSLEYMWNLVSGKPASIHPDVYDLLARAKKVNHD